LNPVEPPNPAEPPRDAARPPQPERAVGFVGVGRMGGGIARRLARSGWRVHVHDPSPAAVRRCAEAGAVPEPGPRELARRVTFVVTSLPQPEDVERLYLEVADELGPGRVAVDVSTVDPFTARRVADAVTRRGAAFVACPLGRGPAEAEAGTNPLYVGGAPEALAAAEPLLAALGSPRYVLGDVEQATCAKLVSNLVAMANLATLAEGYALGLKARIAPDMLAAVLRDSGARSHQLDLRLPWIAAGDFAPRFAVDLALKDLRLCVDVAARLASPVVSGAVALQQLAAASARGHGGEDVGAIWKVIRGGE
jgi:3-hydroxyisobutyrate dehydrogenase